MDIKQLRSFMVLAALENFTRASAHLRVAQSALSRQMARLEYDIGTKLFVPSGRGVRLSEAGRRFQERAHQVLEAFGALEREFRGPAHRTAVETVSLGLMTSVTLGLLPIISRRLSVLFPDVSFVYEEGMCSALEKKVAAQSLDLAVVLDLGSGEPVERVLVGEDFTCVVGRGELLIGEPDTVLSPEEIFELSFIGATRDALERKRGEELARRCGRTLKVAHESVSPGMEMALMEAGEGVMLMTSLSARLLHFPQGVAMREVSDFRVHWVVARSRAAGPEPLKDAIVQVLIEEIGALLAKPWPIPMPTAARVLNPTGREYRPTVDTRSAGDQGHEGQSAL
jgi:LysR family transcriptional activator of glutamate synthase operon